MAGAQPLPWLSAAVLRDLPAGIARPVYDPAATGIGIAHLGPGAFHRAHQAVYVDDLLAAHPEWAISAISLQSSGVRDALRPQDGLYTVVQLGEHEQLRVVGAIRELLSAPGEPGAVRARLADPATRLVTLTITEKGYCLAGDGLDLAHADIRHDLAHAGTRHDAAATPPRSAIGHLVAGLRDRRERGVDPFAVLSCDNLAANGQHLRRALLQFAREVDADLAAWIEGEVDFPCSMVDSITPATDDALREHVSAALGCVDAWPVQRETYTQWVIEDAFRRGRPPLELAGATLSRDVAGHDRAKLRLLNGAHSSLAYVGSLLDLQTVREAMATAPLARFVERLMRESIAPVIALPAGLDADQYIDAILERFRNPAIAHRLSQIAWDGSQKLPVRLLSTIAESPATGRDIGALCLPIAAWMQFVRRQARRGVELVDPLAAQLATLGRGTTGDAAHDVSAFLQLDAVFGTLAGDARFAAALRAAYFALGDGSPAAVTAALDAYNR